MATSSSAKQFSMLEALPVYNSSLTNSKRLIDVILMNILLPIGPKGSKPFQKTWVVVLLLVVVSISKPYNNSVLLKLGQAK